MKIHPNCHPISYDDFIRFKQIDFFKIFAEYNLSEWQENRLQLIKHEGFFPVSVNMKTIKSYYRCVDIVFIICAEGDSEMIRQIVKYSSPERKKLLIDRIIKDKNILTIYRQFTPLISMIECEYALILSETQSTLFIREYLLKTYDNMLEVTGDLTLIMTGYMFVYEELVWLRTLHNNNYAKIAKDMLSSFYSVLFLHHSFAFSKCAMHMPIQFVSKYFQDATPVTVERYKRIHPDFWNHLVKSVLHSRPGPVEIPPPAKKARTSDTTSKLKILAVATYI